MSAPTLTVQFGYLKTLSPSYVGERHIVGIDQAGSERAAYEERPGRGPDIAADPNTLLVMFVGGPDAPTSGMCLATDIPA
jgi:hypothetical protein